PKLAALEELASGPNVNIGSGLTYPRGITMRSLKAAMPALCLLAATLCSARAGDMKHGFVNKVFKSDKGESKYVLFVRHTYKGDKDFPLILFLHGAGERGNDGQLPVIQGIGNAIRFKNKEKTFPFFVIFPQAVKGGSWKAGGADANRALAILEETQKTFKI